MKKLVMKLLLYYKKYISRGYNCRFSPSCSEYVYRAVEKYGAIKGLWRGFKRVVRCHPWSKGGVDLLE
jgi:putative membrane protein insertion efficiency factor